MNVLRRIASAPVHPFALTLFPVLFLVQVNAQRMSVAQVLPHLVIALAAVTVVFVAGRLARTDTRTFAIRLSIIVVWFFAYGHLWTALRPAMRSVPLKGHVLLFPLWTALAIVLIVATGRIRERERVTRVVNGFALTLIVMSAAGLVSSALSASGNARVEPVLSPSDLDAGQASEPRDIYYLVFDRYAGVETLRENHRFGNQRLLDDLRSRGFVLPERTRANYPNTPMSLASSLSMRYLDGIDHDADALAGQLDPSLAAVQRNDVARALQAMGYDYVHVGSWWDGTRISRVADRTFQTYELSEFTRTYIASTALAPLLDSGVLIETDVAEIHGPVAEQQFQALKEIPSLPGPKFVFAHVLMPHPPYVFDRRGAPVDPEPGPVAHRMRAYIEQLLYTNGKIVQVLDAIEEAPGPEPIVIIQADEGPHPTYWRRAAEWTRATEKELRLKFRIINALRLPGVDEDEIPDDHSPVNTFRVVLSEYFGIDLPRLRDASYVYTEDEPYTFSEMTTPLYD